ncbi:hypothetical protein NQ317_004216 [Molorchus minor]|uniref:SID1 transmembrane family member 1 n=1 Tax=Molorchus minor TaxID=1323400 RepID=A0ABQ9JL27_9CUCU|nr:hypothetical protein NQ317_004216 [Molorchus minor]
MRKEWGLLLMSFVHIHCVNITIDQRVANYKETFTQTINSTYQFILFFPDIETANPFRVKAWSTNALAEQPVLIVVQQERQVTSWQVPLLVDSSKGHSIVTFLNTSKTMCHDQMDSIVNSDFSIGDQKVSQSFILALATSSTNSVSINIALEEEEHFYVTLDETYTLSISPSEPRYVFYKFDENASDTVIIEVDSDDDTCLTVSIQDSRCPVLDMNKDIKYEGYYQTVNLKGAITIRKNQYRNGFFVVFVAKPDNYDCSQENSYIPRQLRTVHILTLNVSSTITFKIRNSISMSDYIIASLGTLIVCSIVGVVLTITALVLNRFGTISKNKYEKGGSWKPSEVLRSRNEFIIGSDFFRRFPTKFSMPVPEDILITDYYEALSDDQIHKLLKSEKLTVSYFARHPKRIKQRSYNYLSHTLSIALFYSIPVVQLVVTYQRIVNQTGNEDMCYYNFLCAHPALGFSDFNHIYSNIGYVIFGIIFIFVVIDRHTIIKIRKEKGIPVHYGLFHAMGVALIIEGLLSACYHICPSQSNYQFDTSFMYVMAVLCMIKLYQNRHPDVNATAYSTFAVLGGTIFLATVGILNGSLAIWVIFAVCYTILCVTISFKIYFMNYVLEGISQLRSGVKRKGVCKETFIPIRKARFILLLMANIANYGMLITGICLYKDQVTDFGTFLLGILMGNAVIHAIFYTCMKLVNKERICFEAICYGLCGIATWSAAGVFFLDAATLWTVTPADSRQWNQGCILLNFFDKHDVWHLLSAPALYFSFMFLLCLDDDIVDKDQNEITVF